MINRSPRVSVLWPKWCSIPCGASSGNASARPKSNHSTTPRVPSFPGYRHPRCPSRLRRQRPPRGSPPVGCVSISTKLWNCWVNACSISTPTRSFTSRSQINPALPWEATSDSSPEIWKLTTTLWNSCQEALRIMGTKPRAVKSNRKSVGSVSTARAKPNWIMTSCAKTPSTKSNFLKRSHARLKSSNLPDRAWHQNLRPLYLSRLQVLPAGVRQESHRSQYLSNLPLRIPSTHHDVMWSLTST